MHKQFQTGLFVLLLAQLAGCMATAQNTNRMSPGTVGHQPDLDCPADLAKYCGGWSAYDVDMEDPAHHMAQHDRFVIGRKSGGSNPLTLFPRMALLMRWQGKNNVALKEVRVDNVHDCLVGRIRLASHTGTPPHEWHALTMRVVTKTVTPEVGVENELQICMNPQDNGSWPSACAPTGCKYPDPDDPRNHGGRAHAID